MLSFISTILPIASSVSTDTTRLVLLKGAEIKSYLPQMVELYLDVWRDPPYLYDGTFEEYLEWMKVYSNSKDAIVCLLFDGNQIIGSVTGAPLSAMPEKWQAPFKQQLESVFYLGEEVLHKNYRGNHFGSKLFNSFVRAIPSSFTTLAFQRIEESIEPPLNSVLKQRGCIEHRDKIVECLWRDVHSGKEVPHRMICWTCDLVAFQKFLR